MAELNEFESLKKLVMSWKDENIELGIQLMKGNPKLRTAMQDFLHPLLEVIPDKVRLLQDLGKLPYLIHRIQLNAFEPEAPLEVFLETMPIQRISFSYRKMEKIPLWICKLKQLRYLLLEDCNLKEIPEEIGELENLQQLNLDKNKLKAIPASIGKLQQLRKLQLDFNQIKKLPEELGNLQQLEWLCLERNQIKVLPKSCLNLSNLRWLSIEGTPLGNENEIRSGMFIQTSSPQFAKFCDAL